MLYVNKKIVVLSIIIIIVIVIIISLSRAVIKEYSEFRLSQGMAEQLTS